MSFGSEIWKRNKPGSDLTPQTHEVIGARSMPTPRPDAQPAEPSVEAEHDFAPAVLIAETVLHGAFERWAHSAGLVETQPHGDILYTGTLPRNLAASIISAASREDITQRRAA